MLLTDDLISLTSNSRDHPNVLMFHGGISGKKIGHNVGTIAVHGTPDLFAGYEIETRGKSVTWI